MVTEIGRQPWAIQHVLLTADAVTPAAAVRPVFFSFAVLYLLLGAMVVYLLNALRGGPESVPAPQAVPGLS
jgi:cytochrome d ubiquinol oxidase subunit I